MIFTSLSLTRESSFFSKKTAQIIKNVISPPKKVANAYSVFYQEKYQEYKGDGKKVTQISQEIGSQWKNLGQDQKSIYEKKAEELKKKYENEKENFNKSLNEHGKVALSLLNMNRRALNGKATRRDLSPEQKEFLKSLPEQSALTPRGVFMSQRLKGMSANDTKPSAALASAMKAWSNLSEKEQEPFVKMAQQNLASYSGSIKQFLQK